VAVDRAKPPKLPQKPHQAPLQYQTPLKIYQKAIRQHQTPPKDAQQHPETLLKKPGSTLPNTTPTPPKAPRNARNSETPEEQKHRNSARSPANLD